MSVQPMISIIVPVYNVEKDICRCLDSIMSQTFTDWECICIDDGTPDNSGKICDDYAEKDSRFVVVHKKNGGVSSARNVGLDMAKGEYVTFCDSDDYVESNWLEEQYKDITSGDYDEVVCGFCDETRPIGSARKTMHRQLNRISAKKSTLMDKGIGGYSFLRLIRHRNVIDTRYDTSVAYWEDVEFFYRLSDKCDRILWTNKPLYHYMDSTSSVSRVIGFTPTNITWVEVSDRLYAESKEKSVKKMCNFWRSKSRLVLCSRHLIGGGSTDDERFMEYKKFLQKSFVAFFLSSALGLKQKIILSCICLFNHPEKTLTFTYMIKGYKAKQSL